MATVLKSSEQDFKENPNRIDKYRLFTDMSREKKGINPENLNFDIRKLNSGEFSSLYHFHRHAEELFVILSGSATLRTTKGLEILNEGDLAFFEKGETGAHQLHNHTNTPCIFLDIRTFFENDICEYPDSNKIAIISSNSLDVLRKGENINLFDKEEDIAKIWENLKK